jgi:hypothetical protein
MSESEPIEAGTQLGTPVNPNDPNSQRDLGERGLPEDPPADDESGDE